MSLKTSTPLFFSLLDSFEKDIKKLDTEFTRFLSTPVQTSITGYPFYNLKVKDNVHRYEFALAGLEKENIKIELDELKWQLSIAAEAPLNQFKDDWVVKHKGIALRAFNRTTSVPVGSKVISASMENGILTIDIESPTEAKAEVKKIKIN